jgi:glycosyltransferase involved in cell wall biosynthesis
MLKLKYTIIIPCYNSEKWIAKSIESAINQTYDDYEIIVVDNESTDNSLNIIERYSDRIRIDTAENIYKYSYQEPVEKALTIATGDYFTILGSDDQIESTYIQKINSIISTNPQKINFLQSPIVGIQAGTDKIVGEIKHEYKSLEEFKRLLLQKSPVCTPSMVFKKSLYDEGIIQWDSEKYLGASDYDLYFRLADKGYFIYPYPKWLGYYYRWHETQATWGMHKENAVNNFDKKIQKYWIDKWNEKI